MKDSDLLLIQTPAAAAAAAKIFGKGRYKLYALLAILLLACWSMLTGTGTDAAIRSDFDVLIRLPRFWRAAFEAAYEELPSDASRIREDAISEIARMSMRRVLDLET